MDAEHLGRWSQYVRCGKEDWGKRVVENNSFPEGETERVETPCLETRKSVEGHAGGLMVSSGVFSEGAHKASTWGHQGHSGVMRLELRGSALATTNSPAVHRLRSICVCPEVGGFLTILGHRGGRNYGLKTGKVRSKVKMHCFESHLPFAVLLA